MTQTWPKFTAKFYQTKTGKSPVLEWLRAMDTADKRIIGLDIMRLQFGWPIGMPLCRAMGNGLFEVRSNLTGGKIARVLFFVRKTDIILLNGFIKKTQRTPDGELKLALQRRKEIDNGS